MALKCIYTNYTFVHVFTKCSSSIYINKTFGYFLNDVYTNIMSVYIHVMTCCSSIAGKYGPKESLLHLFVRCKLEGATGMLLENLRGKETMLRQRDYRGRTPAEIAYKKGSKRIVEMLNEAIVSCEE